MERWTYRASNELSDRDTTFKVAFQMLQKSSNAFKELTSEYARKANRRRDLHHSHGLCSALQECARVSPDAGKVDAQGRPYGFRGNGRTSMQWNSPALFFSITFEGDDTVVVLEPRIATDFPGTSMEELGWERLPSTE